MSLRTQLMLGFLSVLSVVLVAIGLNLSQVTKLNQMADTMVEQRIPVTKRYNAIVHETNSSLLALDQWILFGKSQFKDDRKRSLNVIKLNLLELETAFSSDVFSEEERDLYARAKYLFNDLEKNGDRVEEIAQKPENLPALKVLLDEVVPRQEVMTLRITDMIENEKNLAATAVRKKLLAVMADYRGSISLLLANIRAYLISGELHFQKKSIHFIDMNKKSFAALLKSEKIMSKLQLSKFEDLKLLHKAFAPLPQKILDLRSVKDWNLAMHWIETKVVPTHNELLGVLDRIMSLQYKLLHESTKDVQTTISDVISWQWRLIVVALVLVLLVVWWISKGLLTPIREAVAIAKNVSKGKFEIVREVSQGALEINVLTKSLFDMASALKNQIESIEENKARIEGMVNTATDGIITIDENGIIETINPAAKHILGYSAKEVLGENVSMFMVKETGKYHNSYLRRHLETKQHRLVGTYGRELEAVHKDGHVFPIFLTVNKVELSNRTIFCGVLRNISGESEVRKRLVESCKLTAIGSLASGIVHELNQPLFVMRGYAELEIEKGLENFRPEKVYKALEQVIENCQKMTKIITHLAEFSRRANETKKSTISVIAIIVNSFMFLESQFRNRNIEINWDISDGIPDISANAIQLEEVFVNVLVNARDALEDTENPKVWINVSVIGEFLTVSFIDNGPGIPIELQEQVLNPFFTTKKVGKGTGLGLSISENIVKDHGGQLEIISPPEGGVEICISLPTELEWQTF